MFPRLSLVAVLLETTDINCVPFQTCLDLLTHISAFIEDSLDIAILNRVFRLKGLDKQIPPSFTFAEFCQELNHLRMAIALLSKLLRARRVAEIRNMIQECSRYRFDLRIVECNFGYTKSSKNHRVFGMMFSIVSRISSKG
jgi:hypothetical protein